MGIATSQTLIFDIEKLADKARVALDVVARMLIGDPVPRAYAEQVIAAYNAQFSTEYPFEVVDLKFTSW